MKRVVFHGPSGTGKTVLAEALPARTGIPLVYLDPLFRAPCRRREPREPAPGDGVQVAYLRPPRAVRNRLAAVPSPV